MRSFLFTAGFRRNRNCDAAATTGTGPLCAGLVGPRMHDRVAPWTAKFDRRAGGALCRSRDSQFSPALRAAMFTAGELCGDGKFRPTARAFKFDCARGGGRRRTRNLQLAVTAGTALLRAGLA